ncbi:CaiB/BaiF CoA transferase family protein [Solimonas soli]|uniref:CaiB/BaiF CoA transferase family protein n=1 Tax=Solimonas soli TaxID=413479 RepID=UPI001B7FDED1|nr:CoA transferase [Solimonas soli]
MANRVPQPLAGIRVLDFSTLVPGPLCTLMLAEAGAEVVKIERPDGGDSMRAYEPRFGDEAVNFAMLNRGKRSLVLDLSQPPGRDQARALVREADVVVEQFRPGVMDRLGLGYERLRELKPELIYCSITGYGQHGPLSQLAAHDLNFAAETGLLAQTADAHGTPQLPQALIGDIAGGAMPATINILLALRRRDAGGGGCRLDIAMADSLFTTMYWGLGNGHAAGHWPRPGSDLVTGGSPRYQIYRTRDDQFLAVAPLEDKFWQAFVAAIGAPELLDDRRDPQGTRMRVAAILRTRDAADWERVLAGIDVCVNRVRTLDEAVQHEHFNSRELFAHRVEDEVGRSIPALPVPVAGVFRRPASQPQRFPKLNEAAADFGGWAP